MMQSIELFLTDAECHRSSNPHPTGCGYRYAYSWEVKDGFTLLYGPTCEAVTVPPSEYRALRPRTLALTPLSALKQAERLKKNLADRERMVLSYDPEATAYAIQTLFELAGTAEPPVVQERIRARERVRVRG